MRTLGLLFISILPVYLIGLYIYKKDRDKEPIKLLTKLFIFGVLSCFPAVALEYAIGSFFTDPKTIDSITLFIYVFLSIALVEEFCKWFVSYKVGYNHKEFDHIYDVIVYSVFVSLGFACFENILYVFEGGITTGILRAFLSIPGHVCNAIIMGDMLGLAKISNINKNKKLERKYLILSVIFPTLSHTIFDYFIFTQQIEYYIGFAVLLTWIYVYSVKKIKKVSQVKENLIDNDKYYAYCPRCGTKRVGEYCQNCGKHLLDNKKNGTNLT